MKSKCKVKDVILPNTYIHIFKGHGENTEVIINHNLSNKFVNIQLFTFDLELIYPDDIIFLNENSVKIILSSTENVCVLIKKADYFLTKSSSEIGTGLNDKYIQSLFTKDNEVTIPDTFTVLDENTVDIIPILTGAYSNHNYVYVQSTPSYK